MANRLSNLRIVDPVLSALSIGYSNAEYISDAIFPMAQVPKEAGKIPRHNKQSFKLFSTERALRARSNVVNPEDRDWIDVVLDEHDLSVPMDYREVGESDDLDLEASNAFLAQEGIQLRREKMCSDLAFNGASYATAHKVTLSGTDKWSDLSANPFQVVSDAHEVVRKDIARRPNTMVLGATAYAALRNLPSVLERLSYAQLGIVTPQLLASLFDVQRVVVGDAIYVSDDGTQSFDVWGDKALLCYVRPPRQGGKRSVYEPNFGYTLYKRNVETDKYMAEGGKLQFVRNTMTYKPVLVGADAGFLIEDVV